jgi:hypothetical protein
LTLANAIVVLVSLAALAIVLVLRDAARYLALSMTIVVIATSIVLFAEISETRVLVETIPFVLLGACLLYHSARGSTEASNA